jgi:choline dehydrogenase-like flavoprotein
MKKAIVIGSGAGGATAAKELQGKFAVTVLEAGKPFRPFFFNLNLLEKFKKTGLFFDEREIQLLFPTMKIRKTTDKMVLVNGLAVGGTTTISAGNAIRMDRDLQKLGIDLSDEFAQLYREIPITTEHRGKWREATRRMFAICEEMGLNPQPTPKMGNYQKCTGCGRCVFGCPYGIKWDSRQFLNSALNEGAQIITDCKVEKIIIEKGIAIGVQAKKHGRSTLYPADLVILAAGGLATPVILQNTGIECESTLFVDPVLCVTAEWQNCQQNQELSMPFVVQKEDFIISPYFDYLSFFFNKEWKYPASNTLGLMIKLADANIGSISEVGIKKSLTATDQERLQEGKEICREVLSRLGVNKQDMFLGTINAGHPGGMLPLGPQEAETFHHSRLPANLYVADATLFPTSLGNPPILTIMAMAKRVSKLCSQLFG